MSKAPISRKPLFWVLYVLVSAATLVLAWRLFPLAMPLVNLEITMTRDMAVARAEALATQYAFAPADARSAVVFNQDTVTQSYVELEGGGKDAFARMVASKVYAPYWWDVRLFRPGVVDEVNIRFRPDGVRYGFLRAVAETYVRDRATMVLTPEAALALARERATADWNIDLAPYHLIDQSQQTKPNGRVDHLFVFERGEAFGEARIRLRLLVRGDELMEVESYAHVPESFQRRFQEMRSANNTIAGFASVTAGVLYGLLGCILGVLWLLRARYLVPKPAFVAGLAVASLLAGSILANAPTAWFGFTSAQDETTFWLRQVGFALLTLLGGSLALGEVFMAAEGLTRRAFAHHPQLWRVFSREAGASREVAGRVAGGYLFVPVELGFVAVFYYLTNRYLGWWQPSEQLTDPNILSSLLPAITPIAGALQAGMLEECLFRAVPLALGALIGARYGHRRLGIAIAFVLQAVVFGAAHANYPGFPAYSRLVELLLPSLVWATIFLRYGLVPTILLHVLFDLVLMSVPLFLIDAPGADLQRVIVILAGLAPFAVVLARRLQAGAWTTLPDALRNGAWHPPALRAVEEEAAIPRIAGNRGVLVQRSLPLLGALGLASWIAFTPLRSDAPPLAIDRDAAERVALAALAARGFTPGPEWHRMSVPRTALDEGSQRQWHAFVWREAGPGPYRALVGNALAPPLWDVRFARFEGDVADRAEEWRVTVAGDGRVRQVVHSLPEGRAGATLPREDAQALAERALFRDLGSDASVLLPRAADQQKRPARRDWVFAYADPRVNVGGDGEARVQVAVAGDEVVAAGHSLFIPEAWQRREVERDGRLQLLRIVAFGVIAFACIAALVYAVNAWNKGRCDRRSLLLMFAFVTVMLIVGSANNWPMTAFALKTTEPVTSQLVMAILASIAGSVLFALLMGLLAGVGMSYARAQGASNLASAIPAWAAGAMAALTTAGIAAALTSLIPPSLPTWGDFKIAGGAWPWLSAAIAGLALLPGIAVTLFLLSVVDRATHGWSRRLPLAAVILVTIGAAVAVASGHRIGQAVLQGAIEGATTFAFAWLVLRHDLRTVPAFVATGLLLEALSTGMLRATPAAWTWCAVTAIVTVAVAWLSTRYIRPQIA